MNDMRVELSRAAKSARRRALLFSLLTAAEQARAAAGESAIAMGDTNDPTLLAQAAMSAREDLKRSWSKSLAVLDADFGQKKVDEELAYLGLDRTD